MPDDLDPWLLDHPGVPERLARRCAPYELPVTMPCCGQLVTFHVEATLDLLPSGELVSIDTDTTAAEQAVRVHVKTCQGPR